MPLSIVVPVLNEEKNLAGLIGRIGQALSGLEYEVLLIDDHSTDSSSWVAQKLSQTYPVSFYLKKGSPGKAYSLLEGFEKARFENICMIDGDLQYPPEAIPEMLKKIDQDDADIVIANRVERSTSVLRQLSSKVYDKVFNKLLHHFDCDVQSGLKVFRKKVLNNFSVSPSSWTFDLEFLLKARRQGYRIDSQDIVFAERYSGKSKVNILATTWQLAYSAVKLKLTPLSSFSPSY